MEFIKKHSSTSVVLRVMLRNSSTGQGLTGLSSASSGLIISTIADTEASPTNYTVAASNVETITTLGTYAAPTSGKCRFKEVDATNHPGLYEFHLADARWAVSNAKALRVSFSGATNLLGKQICYQLVAFDPDAVAGLGLTYLDAAVSSRASQTSVDTVDDFLDTEIAAIKAKTDNLPADPADASDIAASFSTVNTKLDTIDDFLDTEIAAIKAKTDNLPADPADASDIAASFTTISNTLSTIASYIDTEVGAIKAKTDNLPADPADASDIAASFASIAATLATIAGYIDTEVAAILAAVDTEVAAIKAKTDNLPAAPAATGDIPSAATIADAVWDEALSGHTTAGSAAIPLSDIATMVTGDGTGNAKYTVAALSNAPSGGGGGGGTIVIERLLRLSLDTALPIAEPFELMEDDAYTLKAYLTDSNGDPVTLTGYTLTASATNTLGVEVDAPTVTAYDEALGIVEIAITTDLTGAALSKGWLSVKLTDGTNVYVTTPTEISVRAR